MAVTLFLFVFTAILPSVNSQQLQVIYWELKPYIWIENKNLDGILPFILHKAKSYCDEENAVNITFNVNLKTFINFEKVLTNADSYKYGQGKLENITSRYPVICFPYPVSIRKKEKAPNDVRELNIHNFITAPSISIIISRDHIELSRKVLYGAYTCLPLVFEGFLCSVIAAITIWVGEGKQIQI